MIPTLFSVSYAGLWGQQRLTLPDFVRRAARLGYPAVMLMGKRPHLSVLDADDDLVEGVRRTAAEVGVEISTVAAYTDFSLPHAAEVPQVEMQIAYVATLARLAGSLGARIVRVFTGYSTTPEAAPRDWQTCVTAIRECAAHCADEGVILGVQNHHDIAVDTTAMAEFLADVDHPNCRAMYDPWSPALRGEDLYAGARMMAPLAVQTTVADYVRLPRYRYLSGLTNYAPETPMYRAVPVGEGCIDLAAFFAGLRDGGFDGYVAYEMCSPLRGGGGEENLDAAASRSLAAIRALAAGDPVATAPSSPTPPGTSAGG